MDNTEGDITDVLKALNHEIRRQILRMLHNKREPIAYSVFLNLLNLPASSNVAYHLLLLNKARMVEKDQEGKYSLTHLGKRSALLLDLASESKPSPFSDLYLGFSQLTPYETVLGSWWIFFLFLGVVFTSSPPTFLIGLFFFSLAGVSIFLFVYRTRVIWSLFLINNFLWIYFAPGNRLLLFAVFLTNLIGFLLMFPEMDLDLAFSNGFLIGILLVSTSLLLSLIYLYLSFGGKFMEVFKGKKEDGKT
ncbi:MAG: helix-turn-helix transcriptional regulator [Candidatus Heimdallarchaeota archaeon]|nr:MAG: helix-turn-helix transcriptional regulator [Candidatus Heimdallarchaeota archaeon]